MGLRYNYRPDSDLFIIYNVGTQFASIAPANPPQVRETGFRCEMDLFVRSLKGFHQFLLPAATAAPVRVTDKFRN